MLAYDPTQTTARRLRVAAALWLGTIQFLVVEAVVQSRWQVHYDRRSYFISDLGALHCAPRPGGRFVCSPWHGLMNASFVLQGFLIVAGALLMHRLWRATSSPPQASVATALLVMAGVGVALVGLAPEDTVGQLHLLGAAANFAGGNAGLVMLFFVVRGIGGGSGRSWASRLSAVWAGTLGAVGLVALASFVAGSDWGLGVGGIERVIAYPIPACLPAVAIGVLVATRVGSGATPAEDPAR